MSLNKVVVVRWEYFNGKWIGCSMWSIYLIDKASLELLQWEFLRLALKNISWSDPLILLIYDHRLVLFIIPTLERHTENLLGCCNLLKYKVDCSNILKD